MVSVEPRGSQQRFITSRSHWPALKTILVLSKLDDDKASALVLFYFENYVDQDRFQTDRIYAISVWDDGGGDIDALVLLSRPNGNGCERLGAVVIGASNLSPSRKHDSRRLFSAETERRLVQVC